MKGEFWEALVEIKFFLIATHSVWNLGWGLHLLFNSFVWCNHFSKSRLGCCEYLFLLDWYLDFKTKYIPLPLNHGRFKLIYLPKGKRRSGGLYSHNIDKCFDLFFGRFGGNRYL